MVSSVLAYIAAAAIRADTVQDVLTTSAAAAVAARDGAQVAASDAMNDDTFTTQHVPGDLLSNHRFSVAELVDTSHDLLSKAAWWETAA